MSYGSGQKKKGKGSAWRAPGDTRKKKKEKRNLERKRKKKKGDTWPFETQVGAATACLLVKKKKKPCG